MADFTRRTCSPGRDLISHAEYPEIAPTTSASMDSGPPQQCASRCTIPSHRSPPPHREGRHGELVVNEPLDLPMMNDGSPSWFSGKEPRSR
jgi:hypothetical protein